MRRLVLLNPPLYWRKLGLLVLTMAALVPLVVNKLQVPALLYVSALLLIHVWVLVLYAYRVQWRSFTKVGLFTRLGSVLIFSYLLSKVRYSGGSDLLLSIALAFILHVMILTVLMVKLEAPEAE